MDKDWRTLAPSEIEIIEKILSFSPPEKRKVDLSEYEAMVIDSYDSLGLRKKGRKLVDERAKMKLTASGRFNDDDSGGEYGPLVNILLFSRGESLCELQIYKDDGQKLKRYIVPNEIFADY